MNDDRREQVLAPWRKLLEEPENQVDVEEQFEELLKMADDFKMHEHMDIGKYDEE